MQRCVPRKYIVYYFTAVTLLVLMIFFLHQYGADRTTVFFNNQDRIRLLPKMATERLNTSVNSSHLTTSVMIDADIRKTTVAMTTDLNRAAIYKERRRRVDDVCKNHPEFRHSNPNINLLVDDTYKILYCPVEKTGNSNWRRVFLLLRGSFKDVTKIGMVYRYRYKMLNSYSPEERLFRLQNYTKFMFTRHPFSRVLSAFRDKLLDGPEPSFVRNYVPKVKKMLGLNSTGINITFGQFVQYLIKINQNAYNSHWKLTYQVCQPCAIKYDIIGNYETLNEDANYILQTIGADFEFPNIIPHRTNSSAADAMKEYFEELTPEQVNGLYKKYEIDFKMFGYDIPDYLRGSSKNKL
ncbi:carbohydrate sulfotransferase 11-like [Glandiceps talaboti]